jgi:hypothetical protein
MSLNKNPFVDSELTTIRVVSHMSESKTFYLEVLGATLYREYGSDLMVISF